MLMDKKVQALVRVPMRLHEQFQHEWAYKLVTFEEPRPEGFTLHHEILPEGHSRNDLANKDFCFYDLMEPVHTPAFMKEYHNKLEEMLGNRLEQILGKRQEE